MSVFHINLFFIHWALTATGPEVYICLGDVFHLRVPSVVILKTQDRDVGILSLSITPVGAGRGLVKSIFLKSCQENSS